MSLQLDAKTVHERLLAALAAMRKAESQAVTLFAEVMKQGLYRSLGYASIHLYAEQALSFSRSKTYEFIRLAEALDELPALKQGLESGELPWTKAREVVKVATPETEEEWLALAECKSRRELEKEVVKSRATRDRMKKDAGQTELIEPEREVPAAATAQSLTLRLSPLAKAKFEAMLEKLMKTHHCDREQVLLMALESLCAESTRVDGAAPYQVVVQHCPECETKSVGPERRRLSTAESAQIDCDSRTQTPGGRNRSSIAPSRRRAVLQRDGHRCQANGCRSTHFLEVHHIRPRSRGGGNGKENLITLCSNCHRHLHEQGSH